MPQGFTKHRKVASGRGKGGKGRAKGSRKMKKGGVVKMPKNSKLASILNKQKKVTAQIVSVIENEMANKLQKNGGDLTTVKDSIRSSSERGGKVNHFNPKKQFKL